MRPRRSFEVPSRTDYKPISGYGAIGNTKTVALVGYDGSIDWCCLPRFDSPGVFSALLDRRVGGRWVVAPATRCRSTQRYLENTNVLITRFAGRGWAVETTDFMPCSLDVDAWSAPPEVHRVVKCVDGEAEMKMEATPRFDYGRLPPKVEGFGRGVAMSDEKDEMVLASTEKLRVVEGGATSEFGLKEGEDATFVLSYGEYRPRKVAEYDTETRLMKTEAYWKNWVGGLRYSGRWREQVLRSVLALKLLVYSPTGAMVAAPTTSLPEAIGGERNWDYRYSWIRDSATSLWAFYILGDQGEAERYLRWLIDYNPALDLDLRVMYTIGGSSEIQERTLDHLEGYRGSAPVRVGNAAVGQLQMDAYGYMLDALYFTSKNGEAVSDEMYYRSVKPLARYIVDNWRRPGNGIWEFRGIQEHFVYTKAWCYAGLDRAVKIAVQNGHGHETRLWVKTMREIRREVLSRGWDPKGRTFVMRYGGKELDAANLMLPLMGFIDAGDWRMEGTLKATRAELGKGALLRRYSVPDGLKGEEGAFLLCSFWLAACLAKASKVEEAKKVFSEALGYGNHLGLFSEEVDMKTGEALGNFPQALSHMGLIIAAHEIERAQGKAPK